MKVYTQLLVAAVLMVQLLHEGRGAVTPSVGKSYSRRAPIGMIGEAAERRPKPTPAPRVYKQYGSKDYYKVMPDGLPFADAVLACEKDGAKIFVIDSLEKIGVAKNILDSKPSFARTSDQSTIWSGITNLKNISEFATINGKSVNDIRGYQFGGPVTRVPLPFQCLVYTRQNNFFMVDCSSPRGFACEKPTAK